MAVSKCLCLTLSNIWLDAKIWLVLTHQLIVPSTLLASATNIQTYKATKIHTLKPLTYELIFQCSSKRDSGFFGNYCAVTILLILSIWFSRRTVNVLVFVLPVAFSYNCACILWRGTCTMLGVRIFIIGKFCVKSVLMSVRWRQEKVASQLYGRKIVLWRK